MKIKFFFNPVYPYGNDHYFHEIIVLAEGLKELGHDVWDWTKLLASYNSKNFLIEQSHEDNYDDNITDM